MTRGMRGFGRLLTILAVAVPTATLAAEPAGPGTMVRVVPSDLPPPSEAGPSAANPPRNVDRPQGAAPRVPDGFAATIFAEGFDHARWMAVAPNGDVFLAQPRIGQVTVLRDSDGDGRAETRETFAEGLRRPHGLAIADGLLYVGDLDAVWAFPYRVGALAPEGERVQVTPPGALGDPGGHWTRNVLLSRDGRTLYVAIGSRGNIAVEDAPRATIQAFTLSEDGLSASEQRTYASGLRNPVGIALRPGTDELWAVVNERDGMGDDLVPDYLAHVEEGEFYGWPYAYIGANPQPGYADKAPQKVEEAVVPEVLFRSHTAPLGLTFYDGTAFPEAMRGDAFVGLHGSWNADEPRGYAVARVPFEDGKPTGAYELFATGFWQSGTETARVWGRPVGVSVAADGALLVADDVAQVIWRIAPR